MTDEKVQPRRKRSPSYPYINLKQAIDLIRKFYQAEGFGLTPVSVALEHMNYKTTSGSGVRVLATLLQFGLLGEEGIRDDKRVYLSELGTSILESPDDDTYLAAIQQAALSPDIHRELWEQWDLENKQLPSDANMRYSLLKDFEFHKNAVQSFIEEFKETYFFAQLDKRLHTPVPSLAESRTREKNVVSTIQNQDTLSVVEQIPLGMKDHTIQLIGQPMAHLILPHPLSERNLKHLINWLNLMGPALTVPEDEYFNVSGDDSDDDLQF